MDPTNPAFWERLGFPLATLILIGVGLLRIARWIKPWIECTFEDHRMFLRQTSALLESMVEEQKVQSKSMVALAHEMAVIVTRLEHLTINREN